MNKLMNYKGRVTITHNGMKVKFFENGMKAVEYINKAIEKHQNLRPEKIVDYTINSETAIIVYQYYTLYKEMFLVEIS